MKQDDRLGALRTLLEMKRELAEQPASSAPTGMSDG
jgi:hypothetical protein